MIVVGLGARAIATAADIRAAVAAALVANPAAPDRHGLAPAVTLAIASDLPAAAAVLEAAATLGVPVVQLTRAALLAAGPGCRTLSGASLKAYGVGSVAEAAALAHTGPGGRLLGPRIAQARVTAAVATCEGVKS